jgi:hypothetical protein
VQRETDRYHRIDALPESVDAEFRQAAEAAGLSNWKAFVRILRRVGDVPAAIGEGQRRMAEVKDEPRVRLDFWLPAEVKAELGDLAAVCDVKVGAFGRLLLVGRRGKIHETIAGDGEGAGEEEPVAAGAAAGEP